MKRLLPLLLLLPLAAQAAEWLPVAAPKGSDQFFYDASKLVLDNEEVTYWKKVVFKAPQPVKGQMAASGLFRERIHCGDHTLKLLSHLYQGADGGTIEYVENKDPIAAPIIPESVGDLFEQALCKLARQKQEEARTKAEAEKEAAKAAAETPKPAPEEKKDGPIMPPSQPEKAP